MKHLLVLTLVFSFILFSSCEKSLAPQTNISSEIDQFDDILQAGMPIEGSYIVVLKKDALSLDNSHSLSKSSAVVRENTIKVLADKNIDASGIKQIYHRSIAGFAANITAEQAARLKTDPMVDYIEQDMVIFGGPRWQDDDDPPVTGEVIPWGITRVGGGATYNGNNVAWIIDSGIDLDHPDLNVDASRGAEFVDRTDFLDDDNGHGTHVSGTVAAIDNDIFVVGVAAGATVIPVKVLDRRGSGSTSGVIAGVDFVAANGSVGDVANMSLGGGVSDALDAAVLAASNTGVYFALASGNESDDANYHSPARTNGTNIYTVSAFANGDTWASFSNYGNPPVDYAAPGVSILSTYKGGTTATMQGTSMACPHVAGLLLSTGGNILTDGYVIGDPDGNPDRIAHQ